MNLENKLILGGLLISEGFLLFGTAKLVYHTNQVKKATTKFLNSFTRYLSQRVSRPEDIKGLTELAKYREKCRI